METGKIGGESHYMCRHIVNERNKLKCENEELRAHVERLSAALTRTANWNIHTVGLSVDYGSNGVRDFYRAICSDALQETPAQSLQAIKSAMIHECADACANMSNPYGDAAERLLRAMALGTEVES